MACAGRSECRPWRPPAENGNQARKPGAGEPVETLASASSTRDSNDQTTRVFATCILTLLWDRSWDDSMLVPDKFFVSNQLDEKIGALGRIRTPGLLVRSQTLYPAELRARVWIFFIAHKVFEQDPLRFRNGSIAHGLPRLIAGVAGRYRCRMRS